MKNLHLDPENYRDIFQKLILSGRISAKGHIGTHLDCYTSIPEYKDYEMEAVIVDCLAKMPDTQLIQKIPCLQGMALILYTRNLESNGYGTESYFNTDTFLSEDTLRAILDKHPQFIIIDSHGLGESGKKHVSIDKTCEEHHCHVIENADLSSLKDIRKIRIKISIDTDNPSTGKPCRILWNGSY